MKKALIAMSGGVDSSVAAALMLERGYECIGVTMKLYENEDVGVSREKTCCSLDDIADARRVAERLGMPYYVCNFKEDFRSCVMDKFVDSYCKGMTPNPCIDCNRYLKFEHLYRRAIELGCDTIVTGHYARIGLGDNGRYYLQKALDPSKDQSYVLYNMSQELLEHTCFPLGDYCKAETREMAQQHGLINARKHDSQDICFVPDGDYKHFIETYTGKTMPPGPFVDENGTVLGTHKGICSYTIGQRKGLGISAKEPLFVKEIRPLTNEVVLSSNEALFERELMVQDFNWVSIEEPLAGDEIECLAKIRYRHQEAPATAVILQDGRVKIRFCEPQRAITAGQSAVLYDADGRVLGGGIISPLETGKEM